MHQTAIRSGFVINSRHETLEQLGTRLGVTKKMAGDITDSALRNLQNATPEMMAISSIMFENNSWAAK